MNDSAEYRPAETALGEGDDTSGGLPRRTAWLLVALTFAACTLALLPFLRIIEFSNGGENAVIASVQEIHRGGPWLVPTLHEESRTKKPPLATWMSAVAARPSTTARLSDPDPAARDDAFRDFAFQVRWPGLLAMGGVLVMTYALGALLGGRVLGVLAAAVCGSTLFWLQHARLAITDAQLSLWVAVANYLFALGVLRRRWWPALAGGGAALGLAMMSKGPVALVQSVLPVLAFLAWRRWRQPADRTSDERGAPAARWLAPLAVGMLAFALIGLSWYVLVLLNRPDVIEEWKREVTREGATDLEPSKWYNYVTLFAVLMPWTFFFAVGLIDSTMTALKGPPAGGARRGRIVLALLLLVVPILVMSLFRDRKMRYLLPLITPSAIVAAWGMLQLFGQAVRQRGTTALVSGLHWLPLLVAAVGLPLVGAQMVPGQWRMHGQPWYSAGFALAAAGGLAVLVIVAVVLQRRRPLVAVAGGTALVMLAWNVVFNTGYRHYSEGQSEIRPLAERILATRPDALVYSYRADRPARHAPIDLAIYLNRAVKPVADPAAPELADASAGPRVFVVRQRHVTPLPDPSPLAPPVGGPWRFLGSTRVDEATWYAFVSAGPSAAPARATSAETPS